MTDIKFEAFRTNEDGSAVYIDVADLLSALGQLSPGSDGPTDEFLLDIQAANAPAYRRALYAAGAASRQAEVDRLTAEVHRLYTTFGGRWYHNTKSEVERKLATAESELAATKAKLAEARAQLLQKAKTAAEYQSERDEAKTKLAEVERERDAATEVILSANRSWQKRFDSLGDECGKLRSELASARRVVEPLRELMPWIRKTDCGRVGNALMSAIDAALEGIPHYVDSAGRKVQPPDALASAGTDADRTEAIGCGFCHRDQTNSELIVLGQRSQGSGAKSFICGSCIDECSALKRERERAEPPRPEAGEPRCEHCNMREHAYSKGGRCPLVPSGRHSFDEPTEEPKPEPQPSGERPFWDSPLPWRIVDEEDFATLARIVDANGENVARCASDDDAHFIVAKCNAQSEGLAEADKARLSWREHAAALEAKLSEVERERDGAVDAVDTAHGVNIAQRNALNETRSELERAQRAISEAKIPLGRIEYNARMVVHDDSSRLNAPAVHLWAVAALLDLASAGTDADRTEAPRPEAGESGTVCSAFCDVPGCPKQHGGIEPGQGSLWTTPVRASGGPIPEALVDLTVTREQVKEALARAEKRTAAFRGNAPFPAEYARLVEPPNPLVVGIKARRVQYDPNRSSIREGSTVRIVRDDDASRVGKTATVVAMAPKRCATVQVHGEQYIKPGQILPCFPLVNLEAVCPECRGTGCDMATDQCIVCRGTGNAEPTEEPKPEPQASGERAGPPAGKVEPGPSLNSPLRFGAARRQSSRPCSNALRRRRRSP